MKKSSVFCLILIQIIMIIIPAARAQERGKIVALHPAIGTMLDRDERDHYGFFPNFPHFQSAVFFILPDSSYRVQINFMENGQLQSRVMKLSGQEFLENYYRVVERSTSARNLFASLNRFPEVKLIWEDGASQNARLVKLQGDSLQFSNLADTAFSNGKGALADLSQINLVKHASVKKLLTYALVGGAAGALIGMASGDDPPGWFSMTAEEKALIIGGGILSSTLYFGGSLQIIRATDIEIPLDKLSMKDKQNVVQSILDRKYRTPPTIALAANWGYLRYDDGLSASAYQFSFWKQYKPRLWFGLNYVGSTWSQWRVTRNFESEYESHFSRERRRFGWLSLEIRALLHPYGVLHPYFEWGFLIGKRSIRTYDKDTYTGPYPSTNEYKGHENRTGSGIPVGLGILIPLKRFLRIDVEAKRLFMPNAPWQLQLGLQYKL